MEILKGQFKPELIHQAIFLSLEYTSLYDNSRFDSHNNSDDDNDHKNSIISQVLRKYIKIKGQYIAKTVSFEEHDKQMRKKLTKLILHYNQ